MMGAAEQPSTSQTTQSPGPEKNSAAAPIPSIVAWVDTAPIYYADVRRGIAALSKGKSIDADKLPYVQASALQDLIDQRILSNFLTSSEFSATAAEVDAELAELGKKLQQQQQNLKDVMAQNNISDTALRKKIAQDVALRKYIAKKTTDGALQQYFHDHRPDFDGTERRVSHIVFRPIGMIDEASIRSLMQQARQLRGRIVVRELSFDSAARKYSDGPSRLNGGDLGYIPRQGVASQQFSEAAFALRPGEISQPVFDAFGVHLIKATDLRPGQKKWQDAREELTAAYSRMLILKLMDDLHRQAKIEFFDNFPHFLPGTRELATRPPVGIAQ